MTTIIFFVFKEAALDVFNLSLKRNRFVILNENCFIHI